MGLGYRGCRRSNSCEWQPAAGFPAADDYQRGRARPRGGNAPGPPSVGTGPSDRVAEISPAWGMDSSFLIATPRLRTRWPPSARRGHPAPAARAGRPRLADWHGRERPARKKTGRRPADPRGPVPSAARCQPPAAPAARQARWYGLPPKDHSAAALPEGAGEGRRSLERGLDGQRRLHRGARTRPRLLLPCPARGTCRHHLWPA